MSQHLEVEAKFSVSESTTVPDLTEIHGVAGVDHTEIHNLSAVYFDTDELRLTRAKITLRRRTGGNDAGWHIKFPGSFGRKELQGALDDPGAGDTTPPTALMGHVRALIQGRPLMPIAQVDNERHVSYLSNDQGVIIAEFCDDHVSTISHLPGGARKQWREWEFELAAEISTQETGWELIKSATTTLTQAGAFVSDSPSKLVAALGESIGHAPLPPKKASLPKNDPARAVLAAIEANATKIAEYDPKVRADEWDSVHQMRVATRELRSHMQTFEGILGGAVYLQIEKELKLLATILGRARDAEVIEQRLANLIDSEVGDSVDEETRNELLSDLGRDYQREHARVVAALDSDRYAGLLQSLEDLLVNPPLLTIQPAQIEQVETPETPVEAETAEQLDNSIETTGSETADAEAMIAADLQGETTAQELADQGSADSDATIGHAPETNNDPGEVSVTAEHVDGTRVLLKHLDKAHTKVVKLHKKATKEWNDHDIAVAEREENFHNVRKAIKKLRYSAEAVGAATTVKTKKLYKACSDLQSVLGDFQDAVTTRDELLRRSQLAHRAGKNTFAYGALYQYEQTLSRKYLEGYQEAYQAVAAAYDKLEGDSKKTAKKLGKKK